MVKIEDLKVLAGDFGLSVMDDFLVFNFYKTCYDTNNPEYFIKRILINSMFNEKHSYDIIVSNQCGDGIEKAEYYYTAGLMIQAHFPASKNIRFVEQSTEVMNTFAENEQKQIAFIPFIKTVKSSWWLKLFLNIEKSSFIFAKIKQNDLDFYGITNDNINDEGDISLIVLETQIAVSNDFLKKALISKDMKIKEIVDIMPTNQGKVLYLIEVDGEYKKDDPLMSISFDFDEVLIQVIGKVGSYYTQCNEDD